MLINTVMLFLQDALPVFIVSALLLLRFTCFSITISTENIIKKKQRTNWLYQASILAIGTMFLLTTNMAFISQSFSGNGIEFFFSLGYLLIYLFSALFFIREYLFIENKITKQKLALFILFLVLLLNGTNFNVYLSHYLTQIAQIESLLLGVVLGTGICISIAILLYFTLRYSDENIHPKTSCYFLLLFSAGQLMKMVNRLEQIDILPSGSILWNSNRLLAENSELGYFLTVMFGYEATPSLIQLIIYFTALFLPILIIKVLKKDSSL